MAREQQVLEVGSARVATACTATVVGVTAYRFPSGSGGPQVGHPGQRGARQGQHPHIHCTSRRIT